MLINNQEEFNNCIERDITKNLVINTPSIELFADVGNDINTWVFNDIVDFIHVIHLEHTKWIVPPCCNMQINLIHCDYCDITANNIFRVNDCNFSTIRSQKTPILSWCTYVCAFISDTKLIQPDMVLMKQCTNCSYIFSGCTVKLSKSIEKENTRSDVMFTACSNVLSKITHNYKLDHSEEFTYSA